MPISADQLERCWTPLSADHTSLAKVVKYVPIEYIKPKGSETELLCKECEEVIFFDGDEEVWTARGSGKMRLPKNISATVYRGMYLIKESTSIYE